MHELPPLLGANSPLGLRFVAGDRVLPLPVLLGANSPLGLRRVDGDRVLRFLPPLLLLLPPLLEPLEPLLPLPMTQHCTWLLPSAEHEAAAKLLPPRLLHWVVDRHAPRPAVTLHAPPRWPPLGREGALAFLDGANCPLLLRRVDGLRVFRAAFAAS